MWLVAPLFFQVRTRGYVRLTCLPPLTSTPSGPFPLLSLGVQVTAVPVYLCFLAIGQFQGKKYHYSAPSPRIWSVLVFDNLSCIPLSLEQQFSTCGRDPFGKPPFKENIYIMIHNSNSKITVMK